MHGRVTVSKAKLTAPTFFSSAAAFRSWLERNHDKARELLVGFYRKQSGRGGITYPEALDEALCFGWIDGVRKRFDDACFTIRFTPRKPDSIWSAVNTKRVTGLIELGRMHSAGRKAFDRRDPEKSQLYSYERATCKLDDAYEKRFRANQQAWRFYEAQPAGYQRVSTWWVISAKREETRLRRLAQLIEQSAKGRRLGLLSPTTGK